MCWAHECAQQDPQPGLIVAAKWPDTMSFYCDSGCGDNCDRSVEQALEHADGLLLHGSAAQPFGDGPHVMDDPSAEYYCPRCEMVFENTYDGPMTGPVAFPDRGAARAFLDPLSAPAEQTETPL